VFVLLLAGSNVFAQGPAPARMVRLTAVQGNVGVQRPGEPGATPAAVNTSLEQNWLLITRDGTAQIEFEDGATCFLGNNTVLEFTSLTSLPDRRITRLGLKQGVARLYAAVAAPNTFSIFTPDVTVSPEARGDFRVDVFREGTSVRVLQGNARVMSFGASWVVGKDQTLAMRSGDLQPIINGNPPVGYPSYGTSSSLEALLKGTQPAPLRVLQAPPPTNNGTIGNAAIPPSGANAPAPWALVPTQPPLAQGAEQIPFTNGVWVLSPTTPTNNARTEPWVQTPYPQGQWQYSPQGWALIPNTR
jgi:hypothetical protein